MFAPSSHASASALGGGSASMSATKSSLGRGKPAGFQSPSSFTCACAIAMPNALWTGTLQSADAQPLTASGWVGHRVTCHGF